MTEIIAKIFAAKISIKVLYINNINHFSVGLALIFAFYYLSNMEYVPTLRALHIVFVVLFAAR